MSAIDLTGSVDVNGVRELFAGVAPSIRSRVSKALMDAGKRITAAARATSEFQDVTGKLRASINYRTTDTGRSQSVVVKPADHVGLFLTAGVVAYGGGRNARSVQGRKASRADKQTRAHVREQIAKAGGWRIEPRPFMAEAYATVRNQIADMLDDAVARGLGDVGGR